MDQYYMNETDIFNDDGGYNEEEIFQHQDDTRTTTTRNISTLHNMVPLSKQSCRELVVSLLQRKELAPNPPDIHATTHNTRYPSLILQPTPPPPPSETMTAWLKQEFEKGAFPHQLNAFVTAASLNVEERWARKQVIKEISTLLKKNRYPFCQLYPFGSFATGLSENDGDVKIHADVVNRTSYKGLDEKEVKEAVGTVVRMLRNKRGSFEHAKVIRNGASVECTHRKSGVIVQLAFKSMLPVRRDEFIKLCASLYPVVGVLLKVVRYWAKCHYLTTGCGTTYGGKMKNYCLNLLVLVYCGFEEVIPSLGKLQRMVIEQEVEFNEELGNVDAWDTRLPTITRDNLSKIRAKFPSSLPEIGSTSTEVVFATTVMDLLAGFFNFYGSMDFNLKMICASTFEVIPKTRLRGMNEGEDGEVGFEAVRKYADWLKTKGTLQKKFHMKSVLCVQDPFALNCNIGEGIKGDILVKFQQACIQTNQILQMDKEHEDDCSILRIFYPFGTSESRRRQLLKSLAMDVVKQVQSFVGGIKDDSKDSMGTVVGLKFKAESKFVRQFARAMSQIGLTKRFGSWSLLQKMKSLWIRFIFDFLSTFFEQFDDQMEICKREVKVNDVDNDASPGPDGKCCTSTEGKKRVVSYPELAFKKEAQALANGKCPEGLSDVGNGKKGTVRRKAEKLEDQGRTITYVILQRKGHDAILFSKIERRSVDAELEANNWMTTTTRRQGQDDKRDERQRQRSLKKSEPEGDLPHKRAKLEDKNQNGIPEYHDDHIEKDRRISDIILIKKEINSLNSNPIRFRIFVTLDTSKEADIPTLLLAIQIAGDNNSDGVDVRETSKFASFLTASISKALPAFTAQKLTSWLELNCVK